MKDSQRKDGDRDIGNLERGWGQRQKERGRGDAQRKTRERKRDAEKHIREKIERNRD
jgi:hypothetical protein